MHHRHHLRGLLNNHLVFLPLLFLFVVGVAVCMVTMCEAELFSSVSKLKTLPLLERDVLDLYDQVLQTLPDDTNTQELKRKIGKLEKVNSKYLKNTSLMENPLHAFRLIKRMVKQWSSVFRSSTKLTTSSIEQYKEFLNSTREWISRRERVWPSTVDLSGAASALVRLHNLYNLPYTSLLQGCFLNMTSYPMTSLELSYVTQAAMKLGYVCDAKELFSALDSFSARTEGMEREGVRGGGREEGGGGEGGGGSEEETTRSRRRRRACVERLREKLSDLTIGSVKECDHKYNHSINIPSLDTLAKTPVQTRRDAVRALYHQICRTSMRTDVVYGSGRWCYWQYSYIPYLRFKADVVNSDPFIVVFHDIISDDEIREMKDLSFGKISPSTLAVDQVMHEQQLVRVSQNAWLFDSNPVVARLSRRVQHVTGLSTRILNHDTHAEPYQVLNYGLGGVYGPHEDSVRVPRQSGREDIPHLRNAGDRTATWMYYGTAVLWFNLKRSGQADVRTVHAGCPVLYGDKWVANKWLREAGNVFTRPCLLHPDL